MKTVLFFVLIFSTAARADIYLVPDPTSGWSIPAKVKGWYGKCPAGQKCYKLVGLCPPASAAVDSVAKTLTCPPKAKK